MGCWCETCGITQLPINAGDKVRLFVIAMEKHYAFSDGGEGGGGTCYSNDRWSPIGPPIQGEYDDYGSIDPIIMDDSAKMIEDTLQASWIPPESKGEWEKIPEKFELSDYLNFIERDRAKIKGRYEEQHLGLMFVLEDVYQAMINFDPIESHHNYESRGYIYMPFSEGIKLEFEKWYLNQLKLMKEYNTYKDTIEAKSVELLAEMSDFRLFNSLKENGLRPFKKVLRNLAKRGLAWEDVEVQNVATEVINMQKFDIAMSRARKQWMPQSGKGGQQNESDIYQAICDATQKIIDDREEESREWRDEEPDENGYYPYMIKHNKEEIERQNVEKGK